MSVAFSPQLMAKISRRALYLGCSFLLASLGLANPAYAGTLLGTLSTNSGLLTDVPSADTTLSALVAIGPLSSNCFVVGACPQIAFLQGIDSSANGTTITLNSGVPAFAGVVSALTNGTLDYISAGIVPGSTYGTSSGGASDSPETNFGTSPDFSGQSIGSIVFRVDDVQIGPSLGGTEFNLFYTVSVYGPDTAVPEPATWLTVTLGGFALIGWRWRKYCVRR